MTRVTTTLLLQLTLWVASTHAFFPYIPNGHCAPDEHCGGGLKRSGGSDPASEGITVELYRRPVSLAELSAGLLPKPSSSSMACADSSDSAMMRQRMAR
jgi:hypothetical protein